jgi:outer membrane protein
MYHRWNKIFISVFLTGLFVQNSAYSQQNNVTDTLKLSDVITSVVQNNSLIKQATENITVSDLSVQMAKTSYLPTVDFNGTYSRMAPIPEMNLSMLGFGVVQMYPDNSVNLSLEIRQLLYDFGRTNKSVSIQQFNKEMSELTVDQLKQKLVLTSAGIFYSLYYVQTARNIVQEHLNTLKKQLEIVGNKQKTGSATQYEILSTQVKLSSTETQLSELNTAYEVQLSHLSTFMNQDLGNVVLSSDTTVTDIFEIPDSAMTFAGTHRDELLMIDKKQEAAQATLKLVQLQNYPTIGMFGSGGLKNGYLDDIEKLKPNFVVGLSLKVPIFDGNRKNIKLKMANSSIDMISYEKDYTSRNIYDEISENYAQLQLTLKKAGLAKQQVQQAQDAFNRAEVNFKEGVLTNLDLIYAGDMLSDSQLLLLKNKMDYQVALLKYKASMGERIY